MSVDVENDVDVDLYYEDHGSGQPIVLVDGFPLDEHAWDKQIPTLLRAGYRVITYHRRGFGRSDHPTTGFDFDTFAADLNTVLEVLDATEVVLAGFSMGTGEVGRYLGTYGPGRVVKAVFIAALEPYLLRTDTNPEGLDSKAFGAILAAAVKDRYAYLRQFYADVYNVDETMGRRISDAEMENSWRAGCMASVYASVAAVITWTTDFRPDIAKIADYDVDVLIIHGTRDRILPIDATSRRFRALLPRADYIEISGAPHGLLWTHSQEVNHELLTFLER